jgi:hypothetical protein
VIRRLRGREEDGLAEEEEEEEAGSDGELARREEIGRGFWVGVGGSTISVGQRDVDDEH